MEVDGFDAVMDDASEDNPDDSLQSLKSGEPLKVNGSRKGVINTIPSLKDMGTILDIRFSERVHKSIDEKVSKSVIVRLLGKKLGYKALLNQIQLLWRPTVEMQLIDLDNEYFLVRSLWNVCEHEDTGNSKPSGGYNVLEEPYGPWIQVMQPATVTSTKDQSEDVEVAIMDDGAVSNIPVERDETNHVQSMTLTMETEENSHTGKPELDVLASKENLVQLCSFLNGDWVAAMDNELNKEIASSMMAAPPHKNRFLLIILYDGKRTRPFRVDRREPMLVALVLMILFKGRVFEWRLMGFLVAFGFFGVWDQLRALEPVTNTPWVLGGDFNAICSTQERQGLLYMGFNGPLFTWQHGDLKQRLDRPLLLNTKEPQAKQNNRPFQFVSAWNEHPNFDEFLTTLKSLRPPGVGHHRGNPYGGGTAIYLHQMDYALCYDCLYIASTDQVMVIKEIMANYCASSGHRLIEKVEKRLSGWAAKTLSLYGRITLAKAVLQTIPSYAMQSTSLPKGVDNSDLLVNYCLHNAPSFNVDTPRWRWDVDHNFSVKSTYKYLSPPAQNAGIDVWKNVWNLQIPWKKLDSDWVKTNADGTVGVKENMAVAREDNTIVLLIRNLMGGYGDLNFHHIRREANMVADKLAAMARRCLIGIVLHQEMPSELATLMDREQA
ncbi:hypothetical protein F3Y22_tig00112293pilonHSYRG00284 [Hibiscus syriacus]|uniref:RNase H type-1 domain-containing protein n=1 Tax=Hibiscus syriacus TaxID=106335 RepID=A0A6A2YBQ4_HIBSY|nr:hypothetical protein F3Y22_tig00112293pilonHSYRG00284 [Hibiscus syriacus]